MILTATFEAHETFPPAVWAQIEKALAHVLDSYGLNVSIREDREAEAAMYQRFWTWTAEERAKFAARAKDEAPEIT